MEKNIINFIACAMLFMVGMVFGMMFVGWDVLGNAIISTDALDDVCAELYDDQGYKYFNGELGTETVLRCSKEIVDTIQIKCCYRRE